MPADGYLEAPATTAPRLRFLMTSASGPTKIAGCDPRGRSSRVPDTFKGVSPTVVTVPHSDAASRVVSAPPERVFAAFIDREALTEWLPPEGMRGRFERFDARPGGSYRMILTYADDSSASGKTTADSDVVEVRFVEIVPGARVVQAVDFVSDDPAYVGTMTMTWEVSAVDSGTRVDIRADDVPDGISADDHATGLASSLAKLAEYLER